MEIAGWVGFALTQSFYIPQLIKILRSHDVSGLALPLCTLHMLKTSFATEMCFV
jgi:uncharacterized protein with PQ loop repeat